MWTCLRSGDALAAPDRLTLADAINKPSVSEILARHRPSPSMCGVCASRGRA